MNYRLGTVIKFVPSQCQFTRISVAGSILSSHLGKAAGRAPPPAQGACAGRGPGRPAVRVLWARARVAASADSDPIEGSAAAPSPRLSGRRAVENDSDAWTAGIVHASESCALAYACQMPESPARSAHSRV